MCVAVSAWGSWDRQTKIYHQKHDITFWLEDFNSKEKYGRVCKKDYSDLLHLTHNSSAKNERM